MIINKEQITIVRYCCAICIAILIVCMCKGIYSDYKIKNSISESQVCWAVHTRQDIQKWYDTGHIKREYYEQYEKALANYEANDTKKNRKVLYDSAVRAVKNTIEDD